MKALTRIGASVLFGALLATTTPFAATGQSATLTGVITDANDGGALIGASIVVIPLGTNSMIGGSATDLDGRYSVTGLPANTYTIKITFVGYNAFEREVTLAAGQTFTLNVELMQGGFDLNTVVVTASRRQEKALDAPASISVLDTEEIQSDVSLSSASVLRNTTGVDVAQTGIDRQEIVLRGFNNAFSGATYVLTDYRQASAPSLGVNIYSIMPNIGIDLDRIEVVRGPGSALYGAGVDAGVIHFITKDAFSHQGATVSVMGGERSMFGIDARLATVVNDNIGLKLTGTYGQADDWGFSPDDTTDFKQLQNDHIYATESEIPENQKVFSSDSLRLQRNPDYMKLNVNGSVEYRIEGAGNLTVAAGISRYTATVLSGIGTLQADNFGYQYAQLRYQQGGFFAQAYLNQNNAGDSYVYGSGDVVFDKSKTVNGQAQYDLAISGGRHNIIFGGDVEVVTPNTDGTIYGRFEANDQITEYGVYTQGTFGLTPEFDATVAVRGDYNNVVDQFQLSPRAAIVYKPMPGQSVRASYNRAFSSPGNNSLFLDIVAREIGPVTIRGLGSNAGWTWRRNAAFEPIAGTDLVATSLIAPGIQTPAGLPLSDLYAQVYDGLSGIPLPTIVGILAQNGITVDQATAGQLVALLAPIATNVTGFSVGQLARLNPTTQSFDPIDATTVSDISPLSQTTTNVFEVGYKGLLNNKVLIAVDAYYANKQDFVGPLLSESPFVLVPNLNGDFAAAIATGIDGNALLSGALSGLGLTSAQVAALLVGVASNPNLVPQTLPNAQTPIAIVEALENAVQPGEYPEAFLSYRNFGNIDYQGVDMSVQVLATDDVTLFGNLSWVSDNFFDYKDLGETDESLSLALNAPKLKGKLGARYAKAGSFSAGFSARYTDSYPVRSGPYVGEVPEYFLLDLNAGYDFADFGLRIDVTVQNVLDEIHREFVGAPLLGRVGMARLTYTIK
jgi:iron complex outermembrane receptor protein